MGNKKSFKKIKREIRPNGWVLFSEYDELYKVENGKLFVAPHRSDDIGEDDCLVDEVTEVLVEGEEGKKRFVDRINGFFGTGFMLSPEGFLISSEDAPCYEPWKNYFEVSLEDAAIIGQNYNTEDGWDWDKEGDVWTFMDGNTEPLMYDPISGILSTQMKKKDILKMLNGKFDYYAHIAEINKEDTQVVSEKENSLSPEPGDFVVIWNSMAYTPSVEVVPYVERESFFIEDKGWDKRDIATIMEMESGDTMNPDDIAPTILVIRV